VTNTQDMSVYMFVYMCIYVHILIQY
jgi:hypothetical protein